MAEMEEYSTAGCLFFGVYYYLFLHLFCILLYFWLFSYNLGSDTFLLSQGSIENNLLPHKGKA